MILLNIKYIMIKNINILLINGHKQICKDLAYYYAEHQLYTHFCGFVV